MKIPLCINCKYCVGEQEAFEKSSTLRAGFRYYCIGTISPVTGIACPVEPCATLRSVCEVCGPSGLLFEAKE